MNSSPSCLTHERLRQLSQNELSPPEMGQLDEHVTHCEFCRRLLEEVGADLDWQRELRVALSDASDRHPVSAHIDSSADDAQHDGSVEQFVKLLGPTDDPRMLGRLGPYEIVGILGRGGMGVVFKGFDAVLNRYVAIKLLLPHLATSGAARKRFAREAQAAAAVVDDHVMAIHGVAEWQGIPYLVMPYTRGLTLQKRLSEQGPLELREVLRIGMQAAAGLAAAHAQGLVHRDVKPANMLLAEGVERVTLVDFGLARTIDDASLTRTGYLAGTPQYMSPEQARSEPVDARSDLFSLGSVLYAACTGRAPFRAETSYGVLRLITDSEPTPIRQLNPDLPDWLCRIVERLMAKQPAERFSTAAEVSQLLAGCLAHVQQPQYAPLPATVAKMLPARTRHITSSFFKWAIAMSAVLTGVMMSVFLWVETDPPDIGGTWSGAEWGEVTLTATRPGEFQGSYTTTHNQQPGEVRLTWSRLERRFNGAWSEGADCHGEVSFRLVDQELRGSFTTDASSRIEPGIKPKLGDLRCVRVERTVMGQKDEVAELLHQLDGRWEMEPGQEPADTKIPAWGELEFRDGLLSHLRRGQVVFQGKLKIGASKSPPTFLARDIKGGPSFIGGTFEIPDNESLWLSMPDTSVRRGDGKQPNRVWLFRRIAVKPPTREESVGPASEAPTRTGPVPP